MHDAAVKAPSLQHNLNRFSYSENPLFQGFLKEVNIPIFAATKNSSP